MPRVAQCVSSGKAGIRTQAAWLQSGAHADYAALLAKVRSGGERNEAVHPAKRSFPRSSKPISSRKY